MKLPLSCAVLLVTAPALAQLEPQRNLERIVAERSAFPPGTRVLSVRLEDSRAVVELSAEAVAQGLGDEQADAMVRELLEGLDFFTGLRELEVLVDGQPLWKYLPAASVPPAAEARSLAAARTPEASRRRRGMPAPPRWTPPCMRAG